MLGRAVRDGRRDGSPDYAIQSNLVGAWNCFELARERRGAGDLPLDQSRVPLAALESLALLERERRFDLAADQALPGASEHGVAEDFPLDGPRTLYGATKLAAELLLAEYGASLGVPAVINRCGVIAGPWQFGKVDQGIVAHWVMAHLFRRPLSYIGFGGTGRQVRDVLAVDDLVDLIDEQLGDPQAWAGATVNVGGGAGNAVSLAELTELCRAATGVTLQIGADPDTRPGDIPVYVTDCRRLFARSQWRPRTDVPALVEAVHAWVRENAGALRELG